MRPETMSAEELSTATASRHADRMIRDVQSTTRMNRPPRMAMPTASRANMENVSARVAEDADDGGVVAPNVALGDAVVAPPPPSSPTSRMMSAFREVESTLHSRLTPAEKVRLRMALASPNPPMERALHRQPELGAAALVVGALLVGYLLTTLNSSASSGYRGQAARASSTTRRVAEDLIGLITRPR